MYFGENSLARTRQPRLPVDLSVRLQLDPGDTEEAMDEIRGRNLYVLSPQRAARFIDEYLPEKGSVLSSEQINLLVEDDLLDLLAVLNFDNGPAPGSRRSIRWKVRSDRENNGTIPDQIPFDPQGNRAIERFRLERIS